MIFLERDRELSELLGLSDQARAGQGSLVLLTGKAGIGKTSLVRAFQGRLPPGARMMTGTCDPLIAPAALAPLHDLMDALGPQVSALLEGRESSVKLFSAVLGALREVKGTILVFEDIHWADQGTLDLLRFLSRRVEPLPVLIIATARVDERETSATLRPFLGDLARTPNCYRFELAPLSERAVARLASGHDIPAEELYERTGGNPFFVTELIVARGEVSLSIGDAVLGRWSGLSDEAQQTIQIAAVLGPGVSIDLIDAVAGEDAHRSIDEGIAGGLLMASPGGIGFRHELVREVIVQTANPLRAKAIFRSAIDNASRRKLAIDPARMAHYAVGGGNPEEIRHYNQLAAERALSLGANRQAARHYQHALAAADDQPDDVRVPLLEGYSTAATINGWAAENVRVRRELVDLYRARNDLHAEVDHLRHIGRACVNLGDNKAGEEAIDLAVRLLDDVEVGALHGQVLATKALLLMLSRRNDEAIDLGSQAILIAERFDDPTTSLLARNAIGSALLVSGRIEEGAARLNEGIALAVALGRRSDAVPLRTNLGSAAGEMFELELADSALSTAIEEARAADLDGFLGHALAWMALVRLYQGRWDESTQIAGQALGMTNPDAITQIGSQLAIGRVRARRGDPQVSEALDAALALAEPTGTLQRIAPVAAARAEACWLKGDLQGTEREARRGFSLAVRHEHLWHAGELAYWLQLAGAEDTLSFQPAIPWALQLSGRFSEAADAWTALGCPYESARALAQSNSVNDLRAALLVFERLNAGPMAAVTSRRMRELGATMIPRGPRRSTRENAAGLTVREVDVLEQLADGSTYAEIGATLYISMRTVEHHVSSILRKLGAASRREAVRIAIERGILQSDVGARSSPDGLAGEM